MATVPRERVKFPGSDDPIAPIREERLIPQASQDDAENEEDEAKPPEYKREEIGPRIGDPIDASKAVQEVKEQLDADDMVPLLFPHEVRLQDKGLMHIWAAGVHLVPVSLAGRTPKEMHFYLRAHKVRRAGAVLANASLKG